MHAYRVAGTLKFDRPVDPIGIGAGQCAEPPLGRRLSEVLRTRCAKTEGEVGVGVKVGEHISITSVSGTRTSVSGERRDLARVTPPLYRLRSSFPAHAFFFQEII